MHAHADAVCTLMGALWQKPRRPGVNPLPVASGLFPLLTPEEEQVKEKQAGDHTQWLQLARLEG